MPPADTDDMNLHRTDEVAIRRLPTVGEDSTPRSEILWRGAPTGSVVPGAILEAAYTWRGHCLLLMTDDVPDEDMLGIHLFTGDFRLLDSATLGGPYTTGAFSALPSMVDDELRFRFIGGVDWTVRLLREPGLRLPFIGDARGVTRRFGFRRHFIVHGDPLPESRQPTELK